MDDRAYGETPTGAGHGPTGGPAGEVDSLPARPPAQVVLDTFGRARPVSVGDATRAPGATVKIVGRAAPGPGGPLRAALSGAECVWYRSVVVRHQRGTRLYRARPLVALNPIAPSDMRSFSGMRTPGLLSRKRLAEDRSSSAPFAIDDGTGVLLVDPAHSDIDTDVFGINDVVIVDDPSRDQNALGFGGGPFDHQELHAEWIIPVGAPLFALGTVGGSGPGPVLTAAGPDVVLVSTKPEQQVLSRTRTAADPSAHLPFRGGRPG